ncbi:MAG TPA: PKD domain-containing protein, partial [Roseibacterium sp.]|nr:PKD domain-containing protein [Roseibacterium sp.]
MAIGFDGSGSLDLDSDPLTYAWDFGDGSTGSGVSPSHTYVAAGSYTVELTVNDGTIDSTISSTTATVNGAGGTGAFIQSGGADGLVIMEAENNDGNTAQGGHNWVEVFAPAGFTGASAFQAQPNNNTNNGGSGYALTAPRLDFQVTFSQTGTHYVFVRGRGDTGSDNSLHVGLDGIEVASASTISFASGAGWAYGSNGVKSLEVTTPGVHTINVWMREDGTYVDRILLTTNASYVPTGLELESPRDTGGGNQPPTAVAGGPYSGQEAISVNFNGSGSFDNNGDPLTYTWDFGDGTAGSGVSPSHAYAAAGSYSVSLVVNDGTVDSTASTTTATISIAGSNTPPVAAVGGPYSGAEGVAIGFDGSGSLD